jgi:hypothetical protein
MADFESKRCQLFGSDNEPLSVAHASATEILRSLQLSRRANFLKKAEQFEYDYDDNNYSDYIEDASVHAVTDIRLGFRRPAFIQNEGSIHSAWSRILSVA